MIQYDKNFNKLTKLKMLYFIISQMDENNDNQLRDIYLNLLLIKIDKYKKINEKYLSQRKNNGNNNDFDGLDVIDHNDDDYFYQHTTERLEQERLKQEQERKQKQKQEQEQEQDRERFEQEQLEQKLLERKRLKQERKRLKQERKQKLLEQKRLKQKQLKQERERRERLERERLEQEQERERQAEQERLEQERLERLEQERQAERLERERQERLEQERLERERQERLEQERLEQERQAERLERERQERLEQERLERERQERLEQERLEQERQAERLERERQERLEQERLERERQERLEQERLEQERQAERERLEQERQAERLERERQERLERERLEQERLEREKQNKTTIKILFMGADKLDDLQKLSYFTYSVLNYEYTFFNINDINISRKDIKIIKADFNNKEELNNINDNEYNYILFDWSTVKFTQFTLHHICILSQKLKNDGSLFMYDEHVGINYSPPFLPDPGDDIYNSRMRQFVLDIIKNDKDTVETYKNAYIENLPKRSEIGNIYNMPIILGSNKRSYKILTRIDHLFSNLDNSAISKILENYHDNMGAINKYIQDKFLQYNIFLFKKCFEEAEYFPGSYLNLGDDNSRYLYFYKLSRPLKVDLTNYKITRRYIDYYDVDKMSKNYKLYDNS